MRQQQINHTLHCIDLAHEMGIPSIRVNSGGFRKGASFDDLIAAKGWVDFRTSLNAGWQGYCSIEMEGGKGRGYGYAQERGDVAGGLGESY